MAKRSTSPPPPIDFVLAWVDGNDPAWQQEKARFTPSAMADSATAVRFRDWDNLRYWFRGVERFAPWVNRIHFITWGHLPPWLDTSHPKLHLVRHEDYIPSAYLPTFNSHTIELNMHRIEGLSDRFVYFNDDMFLTQEVQPEDFFRDGLPCDTFGLNCIYFGHDSAGHFNGSNMEIINTAFNGRKRTIMKRDFRKWFSPKNGHRQCLKTFLLIPWEWFPGFHYDHLPSDFLKSTLEDVWGQYGDILDATCRQRFRTESNVNQWLFKYWQFCQGTYQVRKHTFGEVFHIEEKNLAELCTAIERQKYHMVCVNDTPRTPDFEATKQQVNACFEHILPQPSAFERKDT